MQNGVPGLISPPRDLHEAIRVRDRAAAARIGRAPARVLALAALLCGLAAGTARATYTLIPTVDGLSTSTVAPGDPFRLDVSLTSDAADQHNSAIFQLLFTQPGLIYQSYDWAAPYADGPPFDDSTPLLADLPAVLGPDTLTGPGHPAGVTDVELSNVLIGSTFAVGTLVSLDLLVPADFAYRGSLFIAAVPDTFADGFDEIPAAAGQVFELIIVPAPAAWLLLLALPAALRPRRHAECPGRHAERSEASLIVGASSTPTPAQCPSSSGTPDSSTGHRPLVTGH